MASTNSHNPGHVQDVPQEVEQPLESSLMHLVNSSGVPEGGGRADQVAPSAAHADADAIHTKSGGESKAWIRHLWPSSETLDRLFAHEHLGNFVIDRTNNNTKMFESMPIYVRVGMHLLFCSGKAFDTYKSVEDLLMNESIKQGKLYDEEGPTVLPHIQSFIKTYNLPIDELLVQDLTQYPTFNSFFSRRLTPAARPIDAQTDPSVICSPADCRMTVWHNVDMAKKFWIKGKLFSIPELLGHDERFDALQQDTGAMLAIARLAPQDYHRFHAPFDAVIGDIKDIHGELYTVNPQAINENLNVFTMNKRSVMLMYANFGPGKEQVPVAFVAVGAMLVGSIGWSKKTGDTVRKGEELGWFQYGGSTTIVVFPSSEKTGMKFDDDIAANSENTMESLVRVGNHIATV